MHKTVEIALVLASSVALLVVAALALRCVFRTLTAVEPPASRACQRWWLLAAASALAAWVAGSVVPVARELPLTVAIAGLDCWLVTLVCARPTLPRAMARWRAISTVRSAR